MGIFQLIGCIKMPLGRSPKLPHLLKWALQCLPCQLNRHQLEILFLPSMSGDKKIRLRCAHVIYLHSSSSYSIIPDMCSSSIVAFCVLVNTLQFCIIFSVFFVCFKFGLCFVCTIRAAVMRKPLTLLASSPAQFRPKSANQHCN